MIPPRPGPPEETREVVDGRLVEISTFESPGSFVTLARWTEPMALYFHSEARTPAAMELARAVYRTVRFSPR